MFVKDCLGSLDGSFMPQLSMRYCHDSNIFISWEDSAVMAEKGFKVITVKEKYYKSKITTRVSLPKK
ncbi:MAG: hypothetical protein DA330_04540 [Nitrososphaera sp.]|nr:hypothetical protein [Nitrososphaera sp.]